MDKRGIVMGRKSPEKQALAKAMRQEMTPAEGLLWQSLRRNQCGGMHFRRQQVLDGFIADFYCHASGLIVEVDGGIHMQQADYDAARDRIIGARGLRILRLTNADILTDLAGSLARIEGACLTPDPLTCRTSLAGKEETRGNDGGDEQG